MTVPAMIESQCIPEGVLATGAASPLLNDVNLQLMAGRMGLVYGRSGAGKSTLLQASLFYPVHNSNGTPHDCSLIIKASFLQSTNPLTQIIAPSISSGRSSNKRRTSAECLRGVDEVGF